LLKRLQAPNTNAEAEVRRRATAAPDGRTLEESKRKVPAVMHSRLAVFNLTILFTYASLVRDESGAEFHAPSAEMTRWTFARKCTSSAAVYSIKFRILVSAVVRELAANGITNSL
jgi:hypothetical protein